MVGFSWISPSFSVPNSMADVGGLWPDFANETASKDRQTTNRAPQPSKPTNQTTSQPALHATCPADIETYKRVGGHREAFTIRPPSGPGRARPFGPYHCHTPKAMP